MICRCLLLRRTRATQAKRRRNQSQNPVQKNNKDQDKIKFVVAFSASCAGPSKKAPKWPLGVLRRTPGASRVAGPRRPKEAPREAQEPPRPPKPRSASGAVRPAIWRRTAAQELPEASRRPFRCPRGSIFDPPGADLADNTSYIFHETSYTCKDSDAESAAFREAVSLASQPFESTGPEAKKTEKAKTKIPPIRPSKQSLAPKRLANKGGRRCCACGAFRRPPLAV